MGGGWLGAGVVFSEAGRILERKVLKYPSRPAIHRDVLDLDNLPHVPSAAFVWRMNHKALLLPQQSGPRRADIKRKVLHNPPDPVRSIPGAGY